MNTYEEIYHHGIKGQKWGVRRFQNADGSLTSTGKKRYSFGTVVKGGPTSRRHSKWERSEVQNENYTSKQRIQDQKMYSKGAVKRINKNMNEGLGLRAARSLEADRINSYRKKAATNRVVGKQVGTVVGGILGGAAGALTVAAARKHMSKYTSFNEVGHIVNDLVGDPAIAATIVTSGISLGIGLGGRIGRSVGEKGTMLAGGYDPKKKRD